MDLGTMDLKSALLLLIGMGAVSVLMSIPIRMAQEMTATAWARLIGAPAKRIEEPQENGLKARVVALEQWRDRLQDQIDNGHWVTHEECKRTHRAEENR